MKGAGAAMNAKLREALSVNVAVNSAANVLFSGEDGKPLPRPKIVGSATEGALLLMIHGWGLKFTELKEQHFDKATDKILPFNSGKKRATAIIRRGEGGGGVRVLVKGATEWVLADCTHYTTADGSPAPLTPTVRQRIEAQVLTMADKALRTLCIAHRDFTSAAELPPGWEEDPPDRAALVCDGIVGIIDPLRDDVKEAVRTAQRAGVMVRMITGDNIHTAKAIARVRFAVSLVPAFVSLGVQMLKPNTRTTPRQDCGILTPGGLAIEGPVFRSLTPAQLDALLPRIQVRRARA